MKCVYVCSPYSGDPVKNTEAARGYCRQVVEAGHLPIATHLLFPQFMDEETERIKALEMSCNILEKCDEVWAFGKVLTAGMEQELNHAGRKRIPVYYLDGKNQIMRTEGGCK